MTTGTASLRPSPSMDVLSLVHSLGRAEWGPLAGEEMRGARIVLDALASIMWDQHHGRSATTVATARQIADRAAYSERWTRISLHRLEDAGIVQWQRGGVIDGNPQPGRFRIVKSILCDWIEAARRRHDEQVRRYIEETRRRLRALIYKTVRPRLRRSDQAELTSNLPPYRGRKGATGPALSAPKSHSSAKSKETTMTLPNPEYMPMVCGHSSTLPRFCNICRTEAWKLQTEAEKRAAEDARRRAAEAARAKEEAESQPNLYTAYMTETYGPNPRKWARPSLTDPEAQRLARACE